MQEQFDITLRRMTEEDIEQVETIERTCFSVPWSFNAFKSALCQNNTCYICACVQDRVVGYCGMYISFEEGEIPNVAVALDMRRKGIAEKMLSFLFETVKEQGVTSYFLEVRKSNTGAIRLYEKLGFEAVGIRKRFYENPVEDAVIMWKK